MSDSVVSGVAVGSRLTIELLSGDGTPDGAWPSGVVGWPGAGLDSNTCTVSLEESWMSEHL